MAPDNDALELAALRGDGAERPSPRGAEEPRRSWRSAKEDEVLQRQGTGLL
jgi:hypothetical protein